ncbi:ferredoxin [Sphaerisporangium siamense]|uniref:2Fe-2S ferredoxin n=1 Tax=Sphaerisporangium siamense TaxID=795645 RepID=A0A7W7GCF0_9ACTN|nr:2Fe-2S iron-sulfur cluster-binding protein [Sphaerisporangium siamense]MBB4703449.1 2Fe-2S ferredoxin [Sphaerisporangium siamense]GII87557.1 ferredoxin [Sphaerisporangium siamense]
MAEVTLINHSGTQTTLDVPPGTSIMRAAIANGVRGIYAECGGDTMCATCHVYVEPEFSELFPPVNEDEDEMLEATACDRLPTSRLSCRLTIPEGCGAVVVRLPESQR